jgi:hypothetical protein
LGHGDGENRGRQQTTEGVLCWRDGIQVPGVTAGPVAAHVVQVKTFGNLASNNRVRGKQTPPTDVGPAQHGHLHTEPTIRTDPHRRLDDSLILDRGLEVVDQGADYPLWDMALILTDHDDIDYRRVASSSRVVFDTRGVYRRLGIDVPRIEQL